MEKPPILSDEEVTQIIFECEGTIKDARQEVNTAQRDADVEWYEKRIILVVTPNQKQDIMLMVGNIFDEIREKARQEVAREILEEIEKILESTSEEPGYPIPNFYIRETGLKAIKAKYIK